MNPVRNNPLLTLFIGAFCASLAFSLFIYRHIAEPLESKMANDGYDQLARGLVESGTLSFHPNPQPTVLRGPAYPMLVATLLRLGDSAYPLSVHIAQALLHALTVLLCFQLGKLLATNKSGLIAAGIAAVHPFLLWYTPRIVTETFATVLFTIITLLFLLHQQENSLRSAMRLGVALGISALCKQTFLPLLFLAPFLSALTSQHPARIKQAVLLFAVGALLVAPWTFRNYSLSGAVIPVHGLLGFNLKQGDCLAERYQENPLSYMDLIHRCGPYVVGGDTVVHWEIEKNGVRAGVQLERTLTNASLERYRENPGFFLKKLIVNAVMFWTISGSPKATVVTSLLQLPLLVLFWVACRRIVRGSGIRSSVIVPPLFVLAYVLVHLPIYSLARFGVVLIPVMLAYTVAGLSRKQDPQSVAEV